MIWQKIEREISNKGWQDILFIERNLKLLKPRGDGNRTRYGRFNNSSDKYIRDYIALNAVIGCGSGCTVMCLSRTNICAVRAKVGCDKLCPERRLPDIFCHLMQQLGKDSSGDKST